METIKNYLEGMFASMPNTPEVLRAKRELLQMMEDKYNELIADGKSDNEAVGVVISDFGNLDELAEDLGIKAVKEELEITECKMISRDEANAYISASRLRSILLGLGVFLCIACICCPILFESLDFPDVVAFSSMFVMAAVGVVSIVYSNVSTSKARNIVNIPARLDFSTSTYVNDERDRAFTAHSLRLTTGIILCVLCWIPCAVCEEMFGAREWISDGFGPALLFILVGIGVFLIVQTNIEFGAYDKLLSLNGEQVKKHSDKRDVPDYENRVVDVVMHVYWPTITCIYLVWSFLTFNWWITWIIWPIASVVFGTLKIVFRSEEK